MLQDIGQVACSVYITARQTNILLWVLWNKS